MSIFNCATVVVRGSITGLNSRIGKVGVGAGAGLGAGGGGGGGITPGGGRGIGSGRDAGTGLGTGALESGSMLHIQKDM